MSDLNPSKLHVSFIDQSNQEGPMVPRCYTLTHSDTTGDLFLTIGNAYDHRQISGLYTRLMRDEILAEWKIENDIPSLHVHCHVSGGVVFGSASWRYSILKSHMRMVLEAFYCGDLILVKRFPQLEQARVVVHFHARQSHLNKAEDYGRFSDYRIEIEHSNTSAQNLLPGN